MLVNAFEKLQSCDQIYAEDPNSKRNFILCLERWFLLMSYRERKFEAFIFKISTN